MNPETSWTYTHIYPAELFTREMANSDLWRSSELGARIARQLCRELLLLEASDWQFLVTTGAARDYAEARFTSHNDQFNEVKSFWKTFEDSGELTPAQETRLEEIERRDSVFPDIDPGFWAAGAKEETHQPRPETARPHTPADGLPPLERTEPVA
jgi:1,4-alpha-glucan branching enzyme